MLRTTLPPATERHPTCGCARRAFQKTSGHCPRRAGGPSEQCRQGHAGNGHARRTSRRRKRSRPRASRDSTSLRTSQRARRVARALTFQVTSTRGARYFSGRRLSPRPGPPVRQLRYARQVPARGRPGKGLVPADTGAACEPSLQCAGDSDSPVASSRATRRDRARCAKTRNAAWKRPPHLLTTQMRRHTPSTIGP